MEPEIITHNKNTILEVLSIRIFSISYNHKCILKKFAVLVSTLFISIHTMYANYTHAQRQFIRVALIKQTKQVTCAVHGEYKLIDLEKNIILYKGKYLRRTPITLKNSIYIGRKCLSTKRIRIYPKKYSIIYINGKLRKFRGYIDISAQNNNTLLIVNTINIEYYLRGVLYHEMPFYWPIEALKAQAVAARTYALYRMKENRSHTYDVTSDIYSQVYGGRNAERYRTNVAIRKTRGEVLLYKGDIIPAYFHSNCGGHTEDANELWGYNIPPLKGRICKFCKSSPHSKWKKNFRLKDIQDKLNQNGYHLGLIKEIKIIKRDNSGRVKELQIICRDGKSITISGKKFREIIGPNNIKSNLYNVIMKGYYFDLIGKGWGHGVGMCQWGAYNMAKQGYKYKEILQYYYPGTNIVKYY